MVSNLVKHTLTYIFSWSSCLLGRQTHLKASHFIRFFLFKPIELFYLGATSAALSQGGHMACPMDRMTIFSSSKKLLCFCFEISVHKIACLKKAVNS